MQTHPVQLSVRNLRKSFYGKTGEVRVLDDLSFGINESDFVSIHVPLLREGESDTPTYHLINERTLRTMKPTAYLVNTSRGPVVDEKALAKALKERWIAGAALDVYETEPLPPDSPFWTHPKVVLTPHNAADTDPDEISEYVARQIERFEAGDALENVVDRERGY